MSDDGRHAIALIAFIGNVFSPLYFRTRGRAGVTPYDHCAMNVGLYGPGGRRWAFTEYPREATHRGREWLRLGDNQLSWNQQRLAWRIAEYAAPLPRVIRGTVHLYPQFTTPFALALEHSGRHWWQPLIPCARVEVKLERPALSWCGTGYLDSNHGSEPLDEGLRGWTWLRAHSDSGTRIIYQVQPRCAPQALHALRFDRSGQARGFEVPPAAALPRTLWGLRRDTHADAGTRARVIQTLEDGPFYCRTLLQTRLGGESLSGIHESLSLERFRSAWVRALLPLRMRRSRR